MCPDVKGEFFFLTTQNTERKFQSPFKIAPYGSSKPARSRALPSTPPRACSAGRATNELANDRATETAIMRDHRRLHARAPERNKAGRASRALTAAKVSTNWRASSLHFLPFRERQQPNDTCCHGGVLSASVPCPADLWCTRLPWLCPPIRCKGTADCDVHCQLSSEQRES